MSQTGLRHAATEPDHLDGKRDRSRRSASGRAAALRRAPSDSDCSGETASLSADSADRVRPTPVLLRTAKARSRRRGSEWEVLEGLKDGQRFERRPEVFNGYLHKKRKWPLKGWHKRFFVIDGGILVYARSPTDVARGRLHGSVDVGLSVISAKARRRRIDIDADEFIYHLRAKTPDVFRTWLNVLKAHRLYRQHLLTFGARETVPKIHAPLKELPPIDSSGLSSSSSVMTPCSDDAETFEENFTKVIKEPDSDSLLITPCNQSFDSQNPLSDWNTNVDNTRLMPLSFEPLEEVVIRPDICNRSLCSMNCLAKIYKEELNELMHSSNAPKSVRVAVIEKQLHATELERNSKNFDPYIETSLHRNTSIQNATKDRPIKPVFPVFSDLDEMPSKTKKVKVKKPRDASPFLHKKPEPTTTFFLFAHKDKSGTKSPDFLMRRSKKSTNLVKYRNCADEPPLEKPMESPMLLRHSKSKRNRQVTRNSGDRNAHIIPIINNEVQAAVVIQEIPKEHKSLQDTMTASEYDKLTERIVLSIFEATNSEASDPDDIKTYVNRMVKELYNVKLNETDAHPVKILFKCLLEYWLSNSSSEHIRNALKHAKSVLTHSVHMTKDQNVFTDSISNIAKHKKIDSNHSDVQNFLGNSNTKHVTCSFVKDRQIQKLEKLLKSTIYTTDLLGSSNVSTEKDIKLTKKLLNDFVSCSLQTKDASISMQCADINIGECHCEGLAQEHGKDVSRSSTEYQHIKAAFERFIRDTSAPPDKIQKFLEAYLEVLMDESNTTTQSAQYSNSSDPSNEVQCLKCDVQTDSVQNKVSIGVLTTVEKDTNTVDIANDSGQIYLKNVLEKFTLIFAKHLNQNSKESQDKHVQPDDTKAEGSFKLNKDIKYLITENKDENSMVIDLTNYCLDHISLFNDPTTQNNLSVTIKLKERSPNTGESKPQKLNLKFSRETSMTPRLQSSLHMRVDCSARSYCRANVDPRISFKNPYIHCDPINVKKNVKPFVSASDATSKAFKYIYDSEQSLDFSLRNESKRSFDAQDERSCYCISMPRKSTRTSLIKSKNKYQITKRISKDSSLVLRQFNSKLKPIPKRSQNSVFRNRKSTIDKNFIILLLENLTLLSQNVPELYNEISVFYLKLKKKHENINSGVGLLGRIYNESNSFGETSRQADVSAFPYTQAEPTRVQFTKLSNEIGINTDGQNKNQTDQSVSAVTDFKNAEIQTEGILLKKPSVRNVTTVKMKERGTEVVDIESRANWLSKITKGSAISTAIRSILDNEGSSINFRFVPDDAYTRKAQYVTEKRISFKDLIEQLDSNEKDVDFVELRQSSPGPSRNDPGKHCAVFQMKHKDSDSSSKDKSKKHKNFVVFPLFLSPKFPVVAMSSSCFGSSGESDARVSEDLKTIYRCASVPSFVSESGGSLEAAGRSLGQAQLSVQQLQRLLDQIDAAPQHHDTDQVSLEGASPNVKKDRRKFGLRKKKSNSKCASVELAPPLHVDISASHTALSALSALAAPPSPGASSAPPASLPIACSAVRPQSLPGAEALSTSAGGGMGGPASLASLTPDQQLREDFTVLAKDLVATLKGVVSTLVCERGRLRAAMEAGGAGDAGGGGGGGAVAALRNNLNSALHQNSELRSRLSRIHDASDLADVSALAALNSATPTAVNHQFQQSLSFSSSGVSASEFFDAEEHDTPLPATPAPVPATAPVPSPDALLIPQDEAAGVIELDGDSSSEAGSLSSEEGSAGSSDNSDGVMLEAETEALEAASPQSAWRRRSRLPRPRPSPGGPSLWNLLYKNIGKDLSQVAMPVTINEPLNMLQRLCEELEYCSLLELAAGCDSALERMALVAAFAVSAYAATAHRAASKPFNPLLGETYECVRPDKGFKFLAEQVSHHPPVSVCQAAGAQWEWWQEARIKTKFWGKSMEFQPAGTVHLTLPSHRDHYEWNKVTTCVHNLFGGQRWVDQYGDMTIVCHNTGMVAKLNFIKASSWSSSRHEVRGFVTDERSGQRLRISGHWSEAIYAGEPSNKRLLWRPGPMPPEHEVYYGFTKFAMELNEMEPGLKDVLPQTDTRFRPDQRALEEGDVEAAEEYKHHLEQAQRERRRDNPTHNPMWFRKISENGEEMWVFTGEYWKARETGFKDVSVPRIW